MKKVLLLILSSVFIMQVLSAQVFWTDDFEGTSPTSGTRSASNHTNTTDGTGLPTCGSGDYFVRTNIAGPSATEGYNAGFSNIQGSFYWRGEDMDGCASLHNLDSIEFTGINISGRGALTFLGNFAARTTNYENTDQITIKYQIDGGGYNEGITFRSIVPAGSGALQVDTDGNDVGDGGVSLNETFTEFTFSISGSGSTLDLRLVTGVNSSGEELGYDHFRVSEAPLSVEFAAFTAHIKDNNTLLNWQTVSEENNAYFQVEHSIDGRNFTSLNIIEGNGNAIVAHDYAYLHDSPRAGTNYYRLKQVDFNGSFQYSDIISVDYTIGGSTIIFPNPFEESITLQFPLNEGSTTGLNNRSIEVFDLYGRKVYQVQVSTYESNYNLNLSTLSSGTYLIRTSDQRGVFNTQRITKL